MSGCFCAALLRWTLQAEQLKSPCSPTLRLCSLPVLLDHVQQRAAADMLLLAQADASGAAAAVQEAVKDTASSNKGGFFNFFASTFEAVLKASLLQPVQAL